MRSLFITWGQSDKFGNIRVFGTLGWIAINWILSLYLRFWEGREPTLPHVGDCLLFGAVLSLIMGGLLLDAAQHTAE